MDDKKEDFKNTPLSNLDNSVLSDEDNKTALNDIEEERFTTYNPLLSNNIKFKRMYWSSKMEVMGRLLLLVVSCCHLVLAYFLANNIINQILKTSTSTLKPTYVIYIFLVFTLGFNFLFYLPLAIGRTASAVFGWAVVYICLAIGYFFALELSCTILLVIDGMVNDQVSAEIPLFMVIVLLVTILWLVAACLLVIKSDDVRRELSVE